MYRNFFHTLIHLTPEKRRVLPRLLHTPEKWVLLILIASFAISTALLGANIIDMFSIPVASRGGELREGIIGIPRFINPLLAASDADHDLVALIYTGLMRFDGKGNIVPSLAERYTISDDGLFYTFFLKKEVRWSDGMRLTADDVVFTISLAKNPAYRSALRANWEGVIVEKKDDYTISFTLSKPYAPFIENTTIGILPKHIWEGVSPIEFNIAEQNLLPVGAGPYQITSVEKDSSGHITLYALESNPHYIPREPFVTSLKLNFFTTPADIILALTNGFIDSASAINTRGTDERMQKRYTIKQLPLPRVFGVFFNQNTSSVLAATPVRQALGLAVNRALLVERVLENQGIPAYDSIPPGTFGSRSNTTQKDSSPNTGAARKLLEQDGWKMDKKDGIFQKEAEDGKKAIRLSFTISTANTPDLVETAELLKSMWHEIGADVIVAVFEISDLEQNVLRPRKYDAVLFGQAAGFDPDPFAFWHSSQRNDPGLNIATYTNLKADILLEEARKTVDTEKRRQIYYAFEERISQDVPAIFLYSPYYVYVPSPTVQNAIINHIVLPADRFGSIHEWYIRTKKKWSGFMSTQ